MQTDIISTWIYLDSPEEQSEYLQVGSASHLPAFQAVYWRCVCVFFAASLAHNPDKKHLLFTNCRLSDFPLIDGLDTGRFLQTLGVEIVELSLLHQTPKGYFGQWRNQFYIFDILKFIEKTFHHDEAFIVLDSDCIINRPLDAMFADIRKHDKLVLTIPYADDHNINGITRADMRNIYMELDGKDPGANPVYYGGELFAGTLQAIRSINQLVPGIWANMMQRHMDGKPKFNEEAHLLSYCYHKTGGFGTAAPYIKRIWTAPQHNTVDTTDIGLPIWHLPSEKKGGIALLFKYLQNDAKNAPVFSDLAQLGAYVGISKRTKYLDWRHFLKYSWLYKWWKSR